MLNQYKRRADLVPNLVGIVKGYAAHEREVFEKVTMARAQVGEFKLSAGTIENEESLAKFQAAQQQLSGALSRLIAVAENYPQLKADGGFRDLQAQQKTMALFQARLLSAVPPVKFRAPRIIDAQ